MKEKRKIKENSKRLKQSMEQCLNPQQFFALLTRLPSRPQVNVKGSATTVEPAYKPPTAPNSVCAPLSTSDTSVSWTNVNSVERANV